MGKVKRAPPAIRYAAPDRAEVPDGAPGAEIGVDAEVYTKQLLAALKASREIGPIAAELRTCSDVDINFVEVVLGPEDPVGALLQHVRTVLIKPQEVVTVVRQLALS